MLLVPFESAHELRRFEIHDLAVDPRSSITKSLRANDHFFMKSLPAPHDRAEDHNLFSFMNAGDAIQDLAPRKGHNQVAALHAVLSPYLGVKQSQVMVNFRHRGDGRLLPALAQPLLNRHRGRNAGEEIDVGARHDLKKLARVGGKTIDVTPLPLGVDDVKRQRRLSRAAQAGNDHESIARNIQVDIF